MVGHTRLEISELFSCQSHSNCKEKFGFNYTKIESKRIYPHIQQRVKRGILVSFEFIWVLCMTHSQNVVACEQWASIQQSMPANCHNSCSTVTALATVTFQFLVKSFGNLCLSARLPVCARSPSGGGCTAVFRIAGVVVAIRLSSAVLVPHVALCVSLCCVLDGPSNFQHTYTNTHTEPHN